MGIRKIYDAAVKTRTYQDQRTGEQRAVWKDDAKDSVWLTLHRWFNPAGATRKSCAWELLRTLSEMEKENPSEDGLIPPHDADRESA
jgi:hypothetical protein